MGTKPRERVEERLADLDAQAWALLERAGEATPVQTWNDREAVHIRHYVDVDLWEVRSLLDKRAELLKAVDG
jgi:hypothetical protein